MNIHPGMTLYYLNRDCYDPNQLEQLIIPLTVSLQNGIPTATTAIDATSQLLLPLTPQTLSQYTDVRYPVLFVHFEDAKAVYEEEINQVISKISTSSKDDLLRELNLTQKPITTLDKKVVASLYQTWKEAGSALRREAELSAMKERIQVIFQISV
ncbi:hypothetical protein CN918_25820 [Priestia megaterium]|nr:hypothetical protein CN918_25820 [Priestia megaterium]